MEVHGIVYLAYNKVNSKVYIGQTVQTLERRWKGHKDDCKRSNLPFHNAIKKHGVDSFVLTVIGQAFSQEELDEMEKRSIWSHSSIDEEFGYNLEPGGNGQGSMSESTKAKISAAKIGVTQNVTEEGKAARRLANIGRKRSPEHIAAIKAAHIGKVISEETREKMRDARLRISKDPAHKARMRAARIGRPQTEEHKRKCAMSRLGRKHSDETKAKMSASGKGKHSSYVFTEEVRKKISDAVKGRTHTEESKARMREAALLRWRIRKELKGE